MYRAPVVRLEPCMLPRYSVSFFVHTKSKGLGLRVKKSGFMLRVQDWGLGLKF